MGYALGIDVGQIVTTAAVARWDEHGELDTAAVPLGEGALAVPTVVHLTEDNQLLVGGPALRLGALRAQRIEPGALTRLGEEDEADTFLLPTHDLFALVAHWVVDTVAAREGAPADTVVLTHPVSWGQRGEELVRAALAGLGLPEVTLVPGAAAAVVRATTPGPVPVNSTVAVHDLGPTTFDTAVVSTSDRGHPAVVRSAAGFERPQGSVTDVPLLAHTVEVLTGALGAVAVNPGDLSCVLLVGSEAGQPLVADTISRAFGRPVVVDADPMLTTALGAARWGSSLVATRTTAIKNAAIAAAVPAGTHRRGWGWRPSRAGWAVAGALVVLMVTGVAVRAASHDSAQAASPAGSAGRATTGSTRSPAPGASEAGTGATAAGMPSVSFAATPSSAAASPSPARSRELGIAVDDGTLASAHVRVTTPAGSAANSTLLLPARAIATPVGIGVATVPVTSAPAPRTSTPSAAAPRTPIATSPPVVVAPVPSRTTAAVPTSAAPASTPAPSKATTAPATPTPAPTATATSTATPTSKAATTTPQASATTPKTAATTKATAPKSTATPKTTATPKSTAATATAATATAVKA